MCCSAENRERGFSLVELLIAMALALIILGALSSAFVSQRKSYALQEQVSEMIQGARAAMDMMSREVRMAGFAPTGFDTNFEAGTAGQTAPMMQRTAPGSARFVGIPYSATQLQIFSDLNGDEDTSDPSENITYTYDAASKQIDRNTGSGAQPFAENIQAFTFQYLDAGGNTTSTTGDIRQIDITITARTGAPDPNYTHPTNGDGYRTYTLTSLVTPPNLGF